MSKTHRATEIVNRITSALGSFPAIYASVGLIVLWGLVGPIFDFSETWQLVINTTTTIITFIMVFVIQNTTNRESAAVNLKLDKLIQLSEASNRLIGIEKEPQDTISKEKERIHEEVYSMPGDETTS